MKKSNKVIFLFKCTILLLSGLLLTSCTDNGYLGSEEDVLVAMPPPKQSPKPPSKPIPKRHPAAELTAQVSPPEWHEVAGEVAEEAYPERHPTVEDLVEKAGADVEKAFTAYNKEEVAEMPPPERHEVAGEVAEKAYQGRYPASKEATEETMLKQHEKYKVVLGADPLLKIPGTPGELRVWIGFPEYKATFRKGMSQVSGMLPAVGETARVTPFTTGLEVEPKESMCMKIHPTGSEVRFKLIPIKEGVFNVGADVHLFDSDDCSGASIPKAAETLQVEVKVDKDAVRKDRNKKLWKVFWEKFLDFWGAVVTLFFGVVLFLLRKQLKKCFGYKDNG